MNDRSFVGARIRDRRIDQGMRQADLAAAVGISASYLNLIEHNKRRIGGKLLTALADILDVAPEMLSSGADAGVLDGMRSAAARSGGDVELDRAQDIAARFPGWASLIAVQDDRITALEREVQAVSDRMGHDPALAEALHNVITSVTSIRATAGILVGDERIDQDWQRRFQTNLHADSQRLTDQSKALVAYLDRPAVHDRSRLAFSPLEEVEDLLAETPDLLEQIDQRPSVAVESIVTRFVDPGLKTDLRAILSDRLAQHAADAKLLPIDAFMDAALDCEADPVTLTKLFDAPLPTVLRRIAYLPDHPKLPERGLVVCDASGALRALKAVPGMRFSRQGERCPLWPVFSALYQIGQPLQQEVSLPGASARRFMCYAYATAAPPQSFDAVPVVESTMLAIADPAPDKAPHVPVGTNCRICPRTDCAARREPSAASQFS